MKIEQVVSLEELENYAKCQKNEAVDDRTVLSALRSIMPNTYDVKDQGEAILKKRSGEAVVFNLKNHKFQFKTLFRLIFSYKSIKSVSEKEIWVLFIVLKFLYESYSDFTITINEDLTKVLFALDKLDYKREGVTLERLVSYIETDGSEYMKDSLKNTETINNHIERLIDINCVVRTQDEKYTIIETFVF